MFKVGEICGHKMQVLCYQQPDRKLCNKKCPLPLPCGHKCQNNCNQPCTTKCQVLVTNELKAPCGHQFKTPCSYQNKNLSKYIKQTSLLYLNFKRDYFFQTIDMMWLKF